MLKSAAVAGAAVATGGGVLALGPTIAFSAPSAAEDVRILNLVLLVEYVQQAFYKEAQKHTAIGSDAVEYAKTVGAQEDEHVAAIQKALGAKARKKPVLHFGAATKSRKTFLATAIAIEDLTVSAYNGQAANLTKPTLLTAAELISVEARHAGWVRAIAGELPAVGATDKALSAAQATAILAQTGFVKGLHP
jgi:hypothetical protein